MRLLSRDGAKIEIRPISYQFGANPQAPVGADWDANWLVVRGDVTTADACEWFFTDPCLTTWEARELSAWLCGVVNGTVTASSDRSEDGDLLHFTEPNIALSLQERGEGHARIRVHFSLEALPPWLSELNRPDLYSYFLVVDTSIEALAAAADEWDNDCRKFPVR